ncbi:MAG TPA: hypothetical protein VFA94_00135 [Acidimicrobiales bacterium]|nr:hypothetical protein [Acidimicrobiales bacterium]
MRRAWLAAAMLSGIPSTVAARWQGEPLAASTRAAGTLLGRQSVVRGAVAHGLISAWWTWAVWRLVARVPRVPASVAGPVAGLAIAGVDLGIVGRRYPAIRALPVWPQLADHVVFGTIVAVSARRSASRPAAPRW